MVGDGLGPAYSPATGMARPFLYPFIPGAFRPVLGPIVYPNEDGTAATRTQLID